MYGRFIDYMGQEKNTYLEDLAHERVIWKMQRWAWAILVLIVVAAVSGALGRGLLSHAKAGQPNSAVWAEYDRFTRYQAASIIKVHLGPSGNPSHAAVWFEREYLDKVDFERIQPAPERVQVACDRLIYIFNRTPTNESALIAFHLKPSGMGGTAVRMGLVDGPELHFSQFIYP